MYSWSCLFIIVMSDQLLTLGTAFGAALGGATVGALLTYCLRCRSEKRSLCHKGIVLLDLLLDELKVARRVFKDVEGNSEKKEAVPRRLFLPCQRWESIGEVIPLEIMVVLHTIPSRTDLVYQVRDLAKDIANWYAYVLPRFNQLTITMKNTADYYAWREAFLTQATTKTKNPPFLPATQIADELIKTLEASIAVLDSKLKRRWRRG